MARTGVVRYVIDCGEFGRMLVDVHADRTVQTAIHFGPLDWGEKHRTERDTTAQLLRVWRYYARHSPHVRIERQAER